MRTQNFLILYPTFIVFTSKKMNIVDFNILEKIGEGGFGYVLKVINRYTDEGPIALKCIKKRRHLEESTKAEMNVSI